MEADVVIVGAGIAGAALACVLGKRGISVALIDAKSAIAPCFKAEKIEPDQADLLRKLGLLDVLLPHATRIHSVSSARGGHILQTTKIEQYGIFYPDLVNALRTSLPPSVELIVARADDVALSADRQRVTLEDGRSISSRLVVLASGTAGPLLKRLSMRRRMIERDHSISFGFTIAPRANGRFPFDAFTYYSDRPEQRFDYLTLFPIGDLMRANLFAFMKPKDPWVRAFSNHPHAELVRLMPRLTSLISDFEVVSKVEIRAIDLQVVEGWRQPGVVLIGDAFQTTSPTTGTGLSKVLIDLDVLAGEHIAGWLATPGMGAEKIERFYKSPRKMRSDRRSLESALYHRSLATEPAIRWRLRRWKTFGEMKARGMLR